MLVYKEGTTGIDGTDQAIIDSVRTHLKNNGYVIRTSSEDAAEIQKQKDQVYGDAMREIDSEIKNLTGNDKSGNEKSKDYLVRSLTGMKTQLGEITTLKQKISDLEKNGVNGSELAKEYKERLEKLQSEFDGAKDKWKKEKEGFELGIINAKVDSEFAAAITEISPSFQQMNPDVKNAFVQAQIAKFKAEHDVSIVEGMTIYKDKKTGAVKRVDGGSDPEKLSILLKPYFETIIDKEHRQGGAGSGKNNPPNPNPGTDGKKDWSKVQIKDGVATLKSLTEWLTSEQKLSHDSQEFSDAFTHYKKDFETRNPGKTMPIR